MKDVMKFAIVGDQGLVGSSLSRSLEASALEFRGFNRTNLDFTSISKSQLMSSLSGFDVVINAIGYTKVDMAEREPELALFTNAQVPKMLSEACQDLGARFAHISTDYVFEGNGSSPIQVSEEPNPVSAYGRSKLEGESIVLSSGADATIFRSAWLYSSYRPCFPRTIANRIRTQGFVQVVDDQVGQPTYADDLSNQILEFMLLEQRPKIVHAVASGQASWFDFAVQVAKSMGLNHNQVVLPVPSARYETEAKRPAWSVLDNSSDLVEPIGDWRERWLVAADEVLGSR